MTDENMKPEQFDQFKLMYDNVYDELNRSRDWPIKIMAFASAAYLAMYSLIQANDARGKHYNEVKIGLLVLLSLLTYSTLRNIYNQHKRYKEYRGIQAQLENKLKIHNWEANDKPVFPLDWSKPIAERNVQKFGLVKGFVLGWYFYAIYIAVLALIAFGLIILK